MKSEQIDESAPARGQEAIHASTEMQRYAYKGYSDVVGGLNAEGHVDLLVVAADEETFDSEFHSWFTDAKLEHLAEARRLDPELRFYLIAVPNILVSPESLKGLAKTFGRGQPYETYVHGPLFESYTAEELSGTRPDNGRRIQFGLIPSKFSEDVDGTAFDQRAKLRELQKTKPEIRVPSVMEAIAYWNTLREQGQPMKGNETFEETCIRHFDLPEKQMDQDMCVPRSYVDFFGESFVLRSNAQSVFGARLLIG